MTCQQWKQPSTRCCLPCSFDAPALFLTLSWQALSCQRLCLGLFVPTLFCAMVVMGCSWQIIPAWKQIVNWDTILLLSLACQRTKHSVNACAKGIAQSLLSLPFFCTCLVVCCQQYCCSCFVGGVVVAKVGQAVLRSLL